ncbi:MAG: hypothetical protein O7B23_15345, partial [Deltaproteobacteria bacterium]|nr:hypothetical protein [Deltaproteobacteria bacterium]
MRRSRMALVALGCGGAFWPLLMLSGTLPPVCQPQDLEGGRELTALVPIAAMTPLVAILLGTVAALRIKLSRGQLGGSWCAQLSVTLVLLSLFTLMALPRFLIFQQQGRQNKAFQTIQRAQERYHALYPEVGYSPDLRSLGPPPADTSKSARHANLLDPELQAGVYCHGKEPLRYTPRADANGKIAGYSIRIESHGVTRVRDETGKTSTTID